MLACLAFIGGGAIAIVVAQGLIAFQIDAQATGCLAVSAGSITAVVIPAYGQFLPGFDGEIKTPSSRPRAEGKLHTAELRTAFVFGVAATMGLMNFKLEDWIKCPDHRPVCLHGRTHRS
jgi:hypothetical protein